MEEIEANPLLKSWVWAYALNFQRVSASGAINLIITLPLSSVCWWAKKKAVSSKFLRTFINCAGEKPCKSIPAIALGASPISFLYNLFSCMSAEELKRPSIIATPPCSGIDMLQPLALPPPCPLPKPSPAPPPPLPDPELPNPVSPS